MATHKTTILLTLLTLQLLPLIMAECPLDLRNPNLTLAATTCSHKHKRAKCCRYINAFVAISISRYANRTTNLGVGPDSSDICLESISETLHSNGVPRNATLFCGFGTKIPVYYDCNGIRTVDQMVGSPRFGDVSENCRLPLSERRDCRRCLNASIVFLRRLVGIGDNLTVSTCRDAVFAAIGSGVDEGSASGIASCLFGAPGLGDSSGSSQSSPAPNPPPTPLIATSPSQLMLGIPLNNTHHSSHLTLAPGIALGVTVTALLMLVVLILLIRRKHTELDDLDSIDKTSSKDFPSQYTRKFEEGPVFRRYSYAETKKALENLDIVTGQGGVGAVYRARFNDGSITAVKKMDGDSEQRHDEFCREIEVLARLHHLHLVALRGFCLQKRERFLMYEYMENGSLKDHLHGPGRAPLSWRARIQIVIDVANALEYLHFYCDPPVFHGDIKSSNVLLDENFVAKVADIGLSRARRGGSEGTPGSEKTDKSDVYSYGVLLIEIISARQATQDNEDLLQWAQTYTNTNFSTRLPELVDIRVRDSFDPDQLETVVSIAKWCTSQGPDRPSIKQVLEVLYESSDPMRIGFLREVEEEEDGDDSRCVASSSSTSRSGCSRGLILETGSPQSPSLRFL